MEGFKTADVDIIAFIILAVIFANSYTRSFRGVIVIQTFQCDNPVEYGPHHYQPIELGMGWEAGVPRKTALNTVFNALIFSIGPAVPSLCILYMRHQVTGEKGLKPMSIVLASLLATNVAFSVLSAFTGWLFLIDEHNVYSRGQYFWGICCVLLSVNDICFYLRGCSQTKH